MYFDLAPKSNKKDFYNYTYEYTQLMEAIKRGDRIIAIQGIRRVGKTSLMNIVYNEIKEPKVWIDGRVIENPKRDIINIINDVLEVGKPVILGKIEGINLSAFGFGIGMRVSSGRPNLTKMEERLKKIKKMYIFIDEAQQMKRKALANILAYFYDRHPAVSFILSGSEVGLINEILGNDDPHHPLYGREVVRITVNRLDPSSAMEYLKRGFNQVGMDVGAELKEAQEELDGLIGWLTLYGYERGVLKNKNALQKTVELASKIIALEIKNFLKRKKARALYLSILLNASTPVSWSELKLKVEKKLNKSINNNQFSFALNELITYSFLEKRDNKYILADPLILKAAMSL